MNPTVTACASCWRLAKNADPEVILRELYKRTPMQTTFSINLLALVDGEPRTLTLKQALRVYIEHRLTVIKRRAEFDLEKAKAARPHPRRLSDRPQESG